MTGVYLAGRYDRREELQGYAARLAELGVKVTSRWLAGHECADADCSPEELRRFAAEDLVDIYRADLFVAFTEDPATAGYHSGGRHVELGYAIAWGLDVAVVGPRENVFHWLEIVEQFDTFDDFVAWIAEGVAA